MIPQRFKKYPLNLRMKLRFFKIHCETNILHSVIRIEVTDSGINYTRNYIKEALIHSSVNDQSTEKVKCDFTFFFIFNGLTAIEYGSTALCCGNAELIRVSLNV